MLLSHQPAIAHAAVLLFLILWNYTSKVEALPEESILCPIGFETAFTKDLTVCYRKKDPEVFSDLYKDCSHNIFSLELYNELGIDKSNAVWSEYKNAYPGGPFVNMRLTDDFRHELDTEYKVHFQNHSLEGADDLCVVVDPVQKYMAVRCDEKHYRYCFVMPKTLNGEDDIIKEKCEDLKDSLSFSSPVATCLTVLSGTTDRRKPGPNGTIPLRATWNQAHDLCEKKGGSSLLNRGWRYANHPRLHATNKTKTYPLGIIMTSDHTLLRYDASGDHAEIPRTEWNFKTAVEGDGKLLGALSGEEWQLVEDSHIFYDVICERTIKFKHIDIRLGVDGENKLILSASEHIDGKDISCFTDATFKFPNKVKVKALPDPYNRFVLTPKSVDGYYWCVYTDPITSKTLDPEKTLFIRERDSLQNVYAIKFRSSKSYKDDNFEAKLKKWEKLLTEYIYYSTKYIKYMGELPESNTEDVLQNFKRSTGVVDFNDVKVIRNIQVKRRYLDGKTVLLHVALDSDMKAVMPGKWNNVKVLHMRPVYRCQQFPTQNGNTVPSTPMVGRAAEMHWIYEATNLVLGNSNAIVSDLKQDIGSVLRSLTSVYRLPRTLPSGGLHAHLLFSYNKKSVKNKVSPI